MRWGQIKTLFILSFFLLDIYLLFLVLQKQEELSPLESMINEEEQEFLEFENITVEVELPETIPDEPLITTQQKHFSEEEIEAITDRENQEVVVVNNNFIISQMEEPIAIPENATKEALEQIMTNTVYLGNEYTFHDWDHDRNIIILFQEKNSRPVYFNQNGLILVYLNDNNEMIAYTQSYLGELEVSEEKKTIIKPLSAIRKLWDSNLLYSNEKVTKVEIGYHTFLPLDSGRQVLVPTWKIQINESRDRLVNAYEQKVIPVNDEFVDKVLELNVEHTRAIKGNEEFKQNIQDILTSKLQ